MPETKINNKQLPDLIQNKTIDTSNDIDTTTTKLTISGGTNGQVLRTDGSGNLSWTTPAAGVTDGDKGDITVSGSGSTWVIDNLAVGQTKLDVNSVSTSKIVDGAVNAAKLGTDSVTTAKILNANVTFAKIQNVSTNRLLGRSQGSTNGPPEEIVATGGLTMAGNSVYVGVNAVGLNKLEVMSNTGVIGGTAGTSPQVFQMQNSMFFSGGLIGTNKQRVPFYDQNVITLSANQSFLNTTTLANVTNMSSITLGGAGFTPATYVIELDLLIARNSGATNPGYKIRLNCTGTGTYGGYYGFEFDAQNAKSLTDAATFLEYDFNTAEINQYPSPRKLTASLYIASSNTTVTLALTASQKTLSPTTSTVIMAGTTLRVYRRPVL